MDARLDTRLDYLDHASYLAFREMGHHPTLHYTWVYDREVDLDALRRLSDRLQRGRFARVVEPASVWGGRARWVRPDRPVPVEVACARRSRAATSASPTRDAGPRGGAVCPSGARSSRRCPRRRGPCVI